MSVDLTKQAIKLSLVVAINNSNRGIGLNGSIPWRLPNDMKHFARVTTHTKDVNKKNAVIMGKLTWLSIPKHLRPLPNRLNVIISTQMSKENCDAKENANMDNILIFKSFEEAVDTLVGNYSDKIENIYAIGGTQIYKKALEFPKGFMDRIYLTRVFSDVQCDTFLQPANFLDKFRKLDVVPDKENYTVEFNKMLNENNLDIIFEVYEKCQD